MKATYRFVADLQDEQLAKELDAYIAIRSVEYKEYERGIFTRAIAFEEMFEALKQANPELVKQIDKRVGK